MSSDEQQHCVGPDSDMAGKAASCAGCPNASLCASGAARQAAKTPDPDIPLIAARLRGTRLRLMVISNKGGCGKSSVTKELALSLGRRGLEVGVLDADICGPSLPRMLGVRAEDVHSDAEGITPVSVREGVAMMSIHFLMGDEAKNDSITWRGPQKNGTLKSFLKSVNWHGRDALIMDTPPGTTDEHITLASLLNQVQKIHDDEDVQALQRSSETTTHTADADAAAAQYNNAKTCAIVVTTPQQVCINDVRRELVFCRKAKIPVLGLVVNMDGFVCPCCNVVSQIFPSEATSNNNNASQAGGGAAGGGVSVSTSSSQEDDATPTAADLLAAEFGIPILARIPLDPRLMHACEGGMALCEYEQPENNNDNNNNNNNNNDGAVAESPAVAAIEDLTDRVMEMCGY